MLLVKREESRGFDVFFGCFSCVFWCLEEGKMCEEIKQRAKIGKKNVFLTCVRDLDEKRPSKKRFGYLLGHISFWVNGMGSPLFFFNTKK